MTRSVFKLFISVLIFLPGALYAQGERKYIRQGNKEYDDKAFEESEVQYRKALDKDLSSYEGNFNLGDALYKQEKYEDASRKFSDLSGKGTDKKDLAITLGIPCCSQAGSKKVLKLIRMHYVIILMI